MNRFKILSIALAITTAGFSSFGQSTWVKDKSDISGSTVELVNGDGDSVAEWKAKLKAEL